MGPGSALSEGSGLLGKATKAQLKEQRYLIHEFDVTNEVARQTRRALFHCLCWCESPEEYLSPADWLKQVNMEKIYKDVLEESE